MITTEQYLDEMRTVPLTEQISALSDKNWRIFRLLMIAAEQYLDEMRTVPLTEQDFGSKW